jgi:hypothetical protein
MPLNGIAVSMVHQGVAGINNRDAAGIAHGEVSWLTFVPA